MVSVDVKHHVYFFSPKLPQAGLSDGGGRGAGVVGGGGGGVGGGGWGVEWGVGCVCRKSDEQQSMTWIRMSKSWDDVGRSQRDSHGQPGTAG